MHTSFRSTALALAVALFTFSASAQTHLRIGIGDDPDALDPTLSRTYTARIVFASLCDKLFDIDDKLNIVPQLALSHETSPDGKALTIKLRPGVVFHDGEPFDATAAKYSLDRHLTMQGSFRKPELALVDSVEVVDPMTIRLKLKKPFSPLVAQLTDRAGMMVSPKAAEASGNKFALHPVCAGPYKFVERVQQDRIVVEKFDKYWNKDRVFIDKITYLPIVDATVRLANLRAGSLDMIERVLATDIKSVRDNPKLKLSKAVSIGWFGLLVNVANGPASDNPLGKDVRVRRAFDLAIDREALNHVVFNGEFVPGNQWVNPQHPYYQQKFPVPKRDLAKAKALLKEAGITGRIPIDYMVQNTPETRSVAEVIQSMVAEVGFDLKIRVTEVATALKEGESGKFQLYQNTWSGRIDPDGNSIIYQACGAPQNMGHYCDKEIDALHEQARATSDPAERKKIYEKLTEKFLANGWIFYLYHPQYLIAHTDRLEGFVPIQDGILRVVGIRLK
jgi:peptide/nickel transport system substrate-binding protein